MTDRGDPEAGDPPEGPPARSALPSTLFIPHSAFRTPHSPTRSRCSGPAIGLRWALAVEGGRRMADRGRGRPEVPGRGGFADASAGDGDLGVRRRAPRRAPDRVGRPGGGALDVGALAVGAVGPGPAGTDRGVQP